MLPLFSKDFSILFNLQLKMLKCKNKKISINFLELVTVTTISKIIEVSLKHS